MKYKYEDTLEDLMIFDENNMVAQNSENSEDLKAFRFGDLEYEDFGICSLFEG